MLASRQDMPADMLVSQQDMSADIRKDLDEVDQSSPISCLDGQYMCDPAPLTPGKYCCPRSGPSCECSYLGGTMNAFGACENTCDAAPVGWTTSTDENGCVVDIPGPESCLTPLMDMGEDMSVVVDM